MLYQPSFPQPYISDIDATLNNDFTCYINAEGGTQVIAYQLNILNSNGNSIYTTGKVTLATPLYGQQTLSVTVPNTSGMTNGLDYVWNVTLYEQYPTIWVTTGKVQTTSTTTVINGMASYLIAVGQYLKIGTEISQITAYDSATGAITVGTAFSSAPTVGSGYTIYADNVTSNDYYFRARTTPSLILTPIASPIASKSYTFTATYTQAENVGWKYYTWNFYNFRGQLIDTSGQISTGNIQYTFDGFIDNTTYGVEVTLENQDGVTLSSGIVYFAVDYASPSLVDVPIVTNMCDIDALKVEWSKLLINTGVASGSGATPYYNLVANQPYSGGSSVSIGADNQIQWYVGAENDPINVPYESTTYIYWTTEDANFNGTIYMQSGQYVNVIAVSPTPPSTCAVGDKYLSYVDNLLYTAIATNTWGNSGVIPDATVIYHDLGTNTNFIYNGTAIVTTTYSLPTYTVSYSGYQFKYEINNGDTVISGNVNVFNMVFDWLLQSTATPMANTIYNWVDSSTWTDANYWVEETSVQTVSNYWYKLTLLPTELQVVTNAK